MASVYSRYNARSDWLILGHYSPVMPTGRLRACKSQAKSHIINNLLTSNVRSLRENLKPRPCRIDLAIARSIRQGLGLRFSRKDLTLVSWHCIFWVEVLESSRTPHTPNWKYSSASFIQYNQQSETYFHVMLRLVFTSDGVLVGVIIRSVERYDLVKIKQTESVAERPFHLWLRRLRSSEN